MGFMRPYRPISRRSLTRESSSSSHLQVPWLAEMAVAMFPVSVPPTDHSTDFRFDPQADSLGYILVLFSQVRSATRRTGIKLPRFQQLSIDLFITRPGNHCRGHVNLSG